MSKDLSSDSVHSFVATTYHHHCTCFVVICGHLYYTGHRTHSARIQTHPESWPEASLQCRACETTAFTYDWSTLKRRAEKLFVYSLPLMCDYTWFIFRPTLMYVIDKSFIIFHWRPSLLLSYVAAYTGTGFSLPKQLVFCKSQGRLESLLSSHESRPKSRLTIPKSSFNEVTNLWVSSLTWVMMHFLKKLNAL